MAGNLVEPLKHSKCEQKVWHWQQKILLFLQPLLCVFVLAFGTVTVTAGMVTVLHLLTIWTPIDLPNPGFGATLFDRPHRFEMGG